MTDFLLMNLLWLIPAAIGSAWGIRRYMDAMRRAGK